MVDAFVLESPLWMIEGEAVTYSVEWPDTPSAPDIKVYRLGDDISADVLSGANSISGNVVTYQTISAQAAHGHSLYVVVFEAAVNGNTERRKLILDIVSASAGA